MDLSYLVLTVCVLIFTAVAAVLDWRTRRLPNKLTVPFFVAALVFYTISGLVVGVTIPGGTEMPPGLWAAGYNLLWALAGFATGFGILFLLWLIGGGLGGDVKLMGALGAWLAPTWTIHVFIVSGVIALLFVIGVFAWRAAGGKKLIKKKDSKPRHRRSKKDMAEETNPWLRPVPYAVPVALATWAVLAFHLIS